VNVFKLTPVLIDGCTLMTLVNSEVTGPKFTKISHNLARSLRLLTHCDIPFWNVRVMNESALKIGYHGNIR